MRRAAISRSASTVGLSCASLLSSCGSTPLASWRARLAAIMTSSKRLSTTSRQSSTVMRAIGLPAAGWAVDQEGCGPAILRARGIKATATLTNQPLKAWIGSLAVGQQRFEQRGVPLLLLLAAQPAGREDGAHLVDRGV